jgi:hypothetical protein
VVNSIAIKLMSILILNTNFKLKQLSPMALTKKIMGSVAAIALVLSTVLTFAFKSDKSELSESSKQFAPTTWHFTGTEASQIYNSAFWQSSDPSEPSCSLDPETLPCAFTVTDEDIANPSELVTYLNTNYPSDPASVADAADSRKPEL